MGRFCKPIVQGFSPARSLPISGLGFHPNGAPCTPNSPLLPLPSTSGRGEKTGGWDRQGKHRLLGRKGRFISVYPEIPASLLLIQLSPAGCRLGICTEPVLRQAIHHARAEWGWRGARGGRPGGLAGTGGAWRRGCHRPRSPRLAPREHPQLLPPASLSLAPRLRLAPASTAQSFFSLGLAEARETCQCLMKPHFH